jgi:hypothetical protein
MNVKHEPMDYRELEMWIEPSEEKSQKSKKAILTFEDGDTEMWCEEWWEKSNNKLSIDSLFH